MSEYKVLIPTEHYELLNFIHDESPGVAVVNSALRKFEPKLVFDSHLSLTLDLEDTMENGMPSKNEQLIIDKFGDFLDSNIKGSDTDKPNALFLARITWRKTRELVWRLYDPAITNSFLQKIIVENSSPRQFTYRIDPDPNWSLTAWHLQVR